MAIAVVATTLRFRYERVRRIEAKGFNPLERTLCQSKP